MPTSPDTSYNPIPLVWRVVLCLLVAGFVISMDRRGGLRGVEALTEDMRSKWLSQRTPPDDDIVVVAIDEASLKTMARFGRYWRWPRFYHAFIVEYCRQARVIAFDVVYEGRMESDSDLEFAHSVLDHSNQVVSGYYLYPKVEQGVFASDQIPEMERFSMGEAAADSTVADHLSADLPYDDLLDSCRWLGHVTYQPTQDGVLRNYLTVARMNGQLYPSLALATAAMAEGVALKDIRLDENVLHVGTNLPPLELDPDGAMRYIQYARLPKYVAASDVILKQNNQDEQISKTRHPQKVTEFDQDFFKDKIVLVGLNAYGIIGADRESTPAYKPLAGVMIHAAAIQNLLTGERLFTSPGWVGALLMLAMALLPALLQPGRPRIVLVGSAILGLLYFAVVVGVCLFTHWLIPLVAPSLAILMATMLLIGISWSREQTRRRQLEVMEVAKQSFTDMLVHDLKGGISSIDMSMSMIESQVPKEDEMGTALLGTMRTSSRRLLTQVNALLDIRKIEEGRMHLNRHVMSLNELIKAAVREYAPAATIANLELQLKADDQITEAIYADRDILQRILDNLVWNALQYAEPGSRIEVGSEDREDQMAFYVANRGRVLSGEELERVVRPFEAGGPGEKKNVQSVSTGLGLAFCRLATQAHGGDLQFESPWKAEDSGVKVVVALPKFMPEASEV